MKAPDAPERLTPGQHLDLDEDAKDISVGRGRGTQKWRRWIGRDPS